MRLGFDLRIMRYPPGGTAAYAQTTMDRMALHRPEGWEVVGLPGWPRLAHGRELPAPLRRTANVALDVGWLGWGAPLEAARHRLDAWFTPASFLPLALPRPQVAIMHNLAFLIVPELFGREFVEVAERLHRLAVTRAARIITPTEFLREVVVERLNAPPDRVSVIGWGMDHLPVPAESSGVNVARPYALFIGQTQPHWNVDVLLDAWGRGVPDDLILVISGAAGSDDQRLRKRIADEGLAGRVVFTGMLPGPELMALIRDARLFVDPSLAEGFGKPVIETMMLGIPCAVSDRGALPEVTQQAALIFDATDPDAVVDAVTRLHHDDELRRTLSERGPVVTRRFRWETAALGYWDEVRAAIGDPVVSRQ